LAVTSITLKVIVQVKYKMFVHKYITL